MKWEILFKIFRNFCLLTLFTAIIKTSVFAQVNTEAMRKSELKEGFTSTNSFNIQLTKGNSDYVIYKGQVRLDFIKGRYHSFIISNLKHGEQKNKKFINKGFIHLRGVQSFNKMISAEIFGQIEYDDFIKLKRRKLGGAGLRLLRLKKPGLLTVHIGIGAMKETEIYTISTEGEKDLLRSTNYLTTNFSLNKIVNLYVTGYYQVDVQSFSDYRILFDGGLSIKLFKNLIFTTNVAYRFDNEPLPGIKTYDVNLLNGISLRF
ncbi:DUF481 domain-containing protein [candidate division KSB1 bacterium]|nr:DUF481 domain-containing protein [candidate division KSB1 bacterium]MBL7094843.1 DUF481 domain-containing protein [candidate division KSB1 bacterium]